MTTKELLEENGIFIDEDERIYEIDEMQGAIVGITDDNELVYDYDKLCEEVIRKYECDLWEARDFIQTNIVRSIPYIDGRKPIIMFAVGEA